MGDLKDFFTKDVPMTVGIVAILGGATTFLGGEREMYRSPAVKAEASTSATPLWKEIGADRLSMYNPIVVGDALPNSISPILVGDQADGSDVVGPVYYSGVPIPDNPEFRKLSREEKLKLLENFITKQTKITEKQYKK